MRMATMMMMPPIVGTPTLFVLNGSMLASRCVSEICFRFSREMKYWPKIAEMSRARMMAISERNDT